MVKQTDRTLHVDVGGAMMTLPKSDWLWQLRYQKEPDRGLTICNDRMIAAGVLESYLYLVQECTKDEAWRRIKIMREAIAASSCAAHPEIDDSWVCHKCDWRSFDRATRPCATPRAS